MRLLIAMLALVALSVPAAAQTGRAWDPAGQQLSRAELQELRDTYLEAANSSAYSGTLRDQARREAELITRRLEEGDLQVGDRILVIVEGHQALSDTFNIIAGRVVVLPNLGRLPLTGVLRSELQQHVAEYISRFIVSPVVHARALIRLELAGAVARNGFYMVPSDVLLSDAIMLTGGPAPNANLDDIRIERSGSVIWDGDRLRQAVFEGRTLDHLSLRAGDRIYVPERQSTTDRLRLVLSVVGALGTLVLLASQLGAFK